MTAPLRIANPAIESLSREQLLEIVERRLVRQIRRAYERIPFYQDRWPQEAATIESYRDFQRLIPFTKKQDFLDEDVDTRRLASPGSPVFSLHMTSGTTGLGQEVHPLSYLDHEALGSSWVYQAPWSDLNPGDRVLFTFPVGIQTGGLQSTMVAQKCGLVGFQVGPYGTEDKIDYLLRFKPEGLVIAPAFLTRFTAILQSRDTDPKEALPNMKAIWIAGEGYSLDWATRMIDTWGANIYEWYGLMQGGTGTAISCERGIAPGGARGALHCLEHRMVCEILAPDSDTPARPGEEGEMVVTSLFRELFPVIRFRTGDRVKVLDECPCGRPFMTIEAGTVARFDDMMKIRSQNVWPSAIDAVVFADDRVEEYAGRVFYLDDGRESVEVSVEFKPSAQVADTEAEEAVAALAKQLKRRTNIRMNVNVVPYMTLPRYEFKVRRWVDERRSDRNVVRYTRSD